MPTTPFDSRPAMRPPSGGGRTHQPADKLERVRRFYERHAARYVAERYDGRGCEQLAYRIRKQIVLAMLSGTAGTTLDVGCGPAVYTPDLVARGHRPVCVDLSTAMLLTGRRRTERSDVARWLGGEVSHLPFRSGTFDNAIAIGIVAYTQHTRTAIEELHRILRPGGVLIVQCSNPAAPTPRLTALKDAVLQSVGLRQKPHDFPLTWHTPAAFRRLLRAAGFHVESTRGYDFRLPFIERFFPALASRLMLALQRSLGRLSASSWLAEGFVVRARRTTPRP